MLKLLKFLFVIGFTIVFSVFIYFTPYFFFNNILKEAFNDRPIMKYVNEREVEYNIFNRYKNNLFSDISIATLIEDQLKKKEIIENKLIYGIDILIEEENLVYLFKSIKNGKTEAGYKVNVETYYSDFNNFNVDVEIDGLKQTIKFKRNNFIFWKMTDLIFETDVHFVD